MWIATDERKLVSGPACQIGGCGLPLERNKDKFSSRGQRNSASQTLYIRGHLLGRIGGKLNC